MNEMRCCCCYYPTYLHTNIPIRMEAHIHHTCTHCTLPYLLTVSIMEPCCSMMIITNYIPYIKLPYHTMKHPLSSYHTIRYTTLRFNAPRRRSQFRYFHYCHPPRREGGSSPFGCPIYRERYRYTAYSIPFGRPIY